MTENTGICLIAVGMSPTVNRNAAPSSYATQPQEMRSTRGAGGPRETVGDTMDGEMRAFSRPGQGKQTDKQSLDYAWRTGLAGGLAGCAVRFPSARMTRDNMSES